MLKNNHLRYKQNFDELDGNASHIQIQNKIPNDSCVLDVGCACGDLGVYLHRRKNCTVYGLEYDHESIAVAKETRAYKHIEQADLNLFESLPAALPAVFDRIVFGDVLEHLYDPELVLCRFLPFLAQDGRFVISVPNIAHGSISAQLLMNKFSYMEYGILDKTHIRFFTRESIATLTAKQGLKIVTATRTIWDLPGLHPYIPAQHLPRQIMDWLKANQHAYVLQYVFEAERSEQSQPVLEQHNLDRLDAFTPEEEVRIAEFRGEVASMDKGSSVAFSFDLLPPAEKFRIFLFRFKPWLREHLPSPLWHFLKVLTIAGRSLRRRFHMTVGNTFQVQKEYIDSLFRHAPREESAAIFVHLAAEAPHIPADCPKTVAFYLPQFHPFPENDEWWGKGFTEWTNVTRALPQFVGHHQPQVPIDLGFYDLRLPEVMERQVELAKLYGIYGFCFHYYWFSGRRLMERPLFDFLARKNLNMPFCLCWANEPWSRRWDGSENELLIRQDLLAEDDARFVDDLLPFISDSRYITINERPVVIIYRPHFWNKKRVLLLLETMRARVAEHGFTGLYLITALSHDFVDDPRDWGFDAAVEFPPHLCGKVPQVPGLYVANKSFCGSVHDMRALVNAEMYMVPSKYTTFKTVFPAWDNTARRQNNAFIFHNNNPEIYAKWLKNILSYTKQYNGPDEQFVFINAWNEWAEGAHLEPDSRYGYAFLQATADTLAKFDTKRENAAW